MTYSDDEKGFGRFENDVEKYRSGDRSVKKKLVQVIKRINPDIIKGLTACLNQDGLHVWLEMTSDPKIFRLALRYKSPGEPFFVKIKNLTITNARCDQSLLTISKDGDKATRITGSTLRVVCHRVNSGREVTGTINATSNPLGGGDLELAAIPV